MKSIGKILKTTREQRGISIQDVHNAIRVQPDYIKALEDDNYAAFDGKVHSKGFLKIYTEYLGLNVEEILALWRREYELVFEKKEKDKPLSKLRYLRSESFVITPSLVFGSSLIFLVLGFLVYLFVQYRSYTGDPTLDIYYPRDNEVLETDVLDVTGKADLDSEVFINNQQIIVNPDGSFVTSLKLKEGLNTISIRAVNQLDRETEKIKTIIFRPKKEVIVPVIEESSESTQSDSDFL